MTSNQAMNKLELELVKARQTYFLVLNLLSLLSEGLDRLQPEDPIVTDRKRRLAMILDATGWERNDDND